MLVFEHCAGLFKAGGSEVPEEGQHSLAGLVGLLYEWLGFKYDLLRVMEEKEK